MAPKPAFVEFGGGALTGASRTGSTPRLHGSPALQMVTGASTNQTALYHPTYEHRVLPGPLTKLPATKSKESIPLAPQELQEMVKHRDWGDVPKAKATTAAELNQLHKRGLVSEEALAEGKAALESGAGAAQVPISRPPEGHRLTVKAPTGMLKSKWSVDGPPRPSTAAPPPMPTDAKLNKGMQIELVATSELEGAKKRLVDAAVAAAAKAAKAKADKEHLQDEAAAAAEAEATAKAKSAEPSMVDLINAIRTERKESGVAPEQVPALDQVVALLPPNGAKCGSSCSARGGSALLAC